MPNVFVRILKGELPARFVYRDDRCAAFLSIAPLRPGHTLVVPVQPVEHWIDLPPDDLSHLMAVSQKIGQALQHGFQPAKVGLMLAGLEVPHVHVHLVPIESARDLDFANQDTHASAESLDDAAETIRRALQALGHAS